AGVAATVFAGAGLEDAPVGGRGGGGGRAAIFFEQPARVRPSAPTASAATNRIFITESSAECAPILENVPVADLYWTPPGRPQKSVTVSNIFVNVGYVPRA